MFHITGVQRFCSGALLYGVEAWGQRPQYGQRVTKEWEAARSLEDYVKMWKSTPQCHLTREGVYARVLEGVYRKAKHGIGGENMYASQSYATKTWFMADRKRTRVDSGVHVMGFMHWLKELGVTKVGRIHISPYRDGAHGGECKGAVYAPDLPKVRTLLDEWLHQWNEHSKAVCNMYYQPVNKIKAADEVAALWE
jgi:hypothetical protein